jgi:hypothetical protein
MAYKIKLKQSKTRRPRGLQALVQQAEREVTRRRQELAVLVELDAGNVAGMDHVGGLLDALHTDLDSIEADLDEFIKKGDK